MGFARKAGRAAGGLLAAMLLAVGAWVGANTLLAEPRPAPAFTLADLPKPPPDAENGFLYAVRGLGKVPEVPRELPPLLVAGAIDKPLDAAALAALRPPLAALREDAEATQALSIYEAALAKDSFFDTCSDARGDSCLVIPLHRAHRLEEAAILDRAMAGRPDVAAAATARLLVADARFASSARSLLAQVMATGAARRSLVLAAYLAPSASPSGRALLAEAVRPLTEKTTDLTRVVKAHYLYEMGIVDRVASASLSLRVQEPSSAITQDIGFWDRFASRYLLDRGATERVLGERAKHAVRWAELRDVPLPEDARSASGPSALFYNPVGKLLLGGGLPRATMERAREDGDALRKEAAAVAQRLQ